MKKVSGLVVCLASSIGLSSGLTNTALAANVEMSGFADIVYVVSDGVNDSVAGASNESRFDVSAELDLKSKINNAMSVRIDVDLNTNSTNISSGDSARIEQTFFAWESSNGIKVMGGVFNNPLGWEAEDAPDLYQISHGQIYTIWDNQTDFSGNNVAGVAVTADVGPIQITGALLNDLGNVAEEQSILGMVNFAPENVPGLAVEAGFVTQDLGAETIIDVNATFEMSLLTVGAEIMLPSELIDFAISSTASYKVTDQIALTGRFSQVSYDIPGAGALNGDALSITFAASYMLDKNLVVNAELRINDSDFTDTNSGLFGGCSDVTCDGEVVQIEAIATF